MRQKYEVLDLDYNKLPPRKWVRTDSSGGECHIIPIRNKRDKIAAISVVDGVLRIFVEVDE